MSAREAILARIRARQGKPPAASDAEREAVRRHIDARAENARPRAPHDAVGRFVGQARRLESSVVEVRTLAEVPAAVARYLRENALPQEAVCWPGLAGLDWAGAGMRVEARGARESDLVGITGAFCAIAETGTLFMLSGPHTPGTVSLLPETHVAVLDASRIVNAMEDAWKLVRAENATLPRAVSLISGPSRSADIEQTVTVGVHGPYRVHIVLAREQAQVDSPAAG